MFIDGEECGHPLTRVDLEAKKIARYDLVVCDAAWVIAPFFFPSRNRKRDPRHDPRKQMMS